MNFNSRCTAARSWPESGHRSAGIPAGVAGVPPQRKKESGYENWEHATTTARRASEAQRCALAPDA
jgi:hypothetical protein